MEKFLKNLEAHMISRTWEARLSCYEQCKEMCKELCDKVDRIKAIYDKIGDVEAVKAEDAEETLKAKAKEIATEEPVKDKIRIVMSSRSLKAVDEVTAEIIRVAKSMGLRVWGPCRAPNLVLDIKTRLAPFSEDSDSRSFPATVADDANATLIPYWADPDHGAELDKNAGPGDLVDGNQSGTYGDLKLRVYGTTVDVLSSAKVVEEIVSGCNVDDVKIEIIVVNTGGRRP